MLRVLELTVPQPHGQPEMHWPQSFSPSRQILVHSPNNTPPSPCVSFPQFAASPACCMCSVCHTRRMGNVFRIVFLVCLDSHRPHIVSHCFVFAFELIARCTACSFTCCLLKSCPKYQSNKHVGMWNASTHKEKRSSNHLVIFYLYFSLSFQLFLHNMRQTQPLLILYHLKCFY